MKNKIWWVPVLPQNGGVVGQLYVSRETADMVWGNVDGIDYERVRLVPVKSKKKSKKK